MKENFRDWRPSAESLGLLHSANRILEAYEKQGYTLTLRQLYYQLVAGGLVANTLQSYNRVERTINRGRLAGYVDWSMIRTVQEYLDRTVIGSHLNKFYVLRLKVITKLAGKIKSIILKCGAKRMQ